MFFSTRLGGKIIKFFAKQGQFNAFGSRGQFTLKVENVKFVNFPESDNCGHAHYAIYSNGMHQAACSGLSVKNVEFINVPETQKLKFWNYDQVSVIRSRYSECTVNRKKRKTKSQVK